MSSGQGTAGDHLNPHPQKQCVKDEGVMFGEVVGAQCGCHK